MKVDNYVRAAAENFNFAANDGWGNENALILHGLGLMGCKNKSERMVLTNLLSQIPYEKKYAGVACFYEMENGTSEVKNRIKGLMEELNETFDSVDDEMALVFYTKYETKLGGKEHYQDVMNRYKAAAAKPEKNNAYFMAAVIEGIESIDQAVYEYYDGLKKLFKEAFSKLWVEEELDVNEKAFAAFAILKACRLKVILAEKYEQIGLTLYEQVVAEAESDELNRGAVLMLLAEKALH